MKLTRKQFLAALAILTTLPSRLLGLSFKPAATLSQTPIAPPVPQPLRLGPWLADWRLCPRVPVYESVHPLGQRLILASLRHEMVTIRYWGGTIPGAVRNVSSSMVFQAGGYGPLYLAGYCHLRRQERVFRVDRMDLKADDETVMITE